MPTFKEFNFKLFVKKPILSSVNIQMNKFTWFIVSHFEKLSSVTYYVSVIFCCFFFVRKGHFEQSKLGSSRQSFRLMDQNPLFVGTPFLQNVQYHKQNDMHNVGFMNKQLRGRAGTMGLTVYISLLVVGMLVLLTLGQFRDMCLASLSTIFRLHRGGQF